MAVLVKAPERIKKVCADIARHFQERCASVSARRLSPSIERACPLQEGLDEYLPPEVRHVMTVNSGRPSTRLSRERRRREAPRPFSRPCRPAENLDRHSKLLTGFDAPILQRCTRQPLRDHTLLQPSAAPTAYGEANDAWLIVDYLGIFDDCGSGDSVSTRRHHRVVPTSTNFLVSCPTHAEMPCLLPVSIAPSSGTRG